MVDYAELSFNPGREAAMLELRGVAAGNLERRVFAGARPDPDQSCGRIAVYAAGLEHNLAELYATRSKLALLRLWALSSDTQEGGPAIFEAARLAAGQARGDARWGYLTLQAIRADGLTAGDIVRIGPDPDNQRGSVRLRDPNENPTGFIALEVDAEGPFLFMSDGQRTITITPQGVEGWPDKGEWSFVAEHPDDPASEIHYNVLEGPEVGVYVRGSASLVDGRALVALPPHFAHVAARNGLTVQLTPRSGLSRGVAASNLTLDELEIVELYGGTGSYEVDYHVHGIRRGRERFEVVRPRRRVARAARAIEAEEADEVSDGAG